MQNRTQFYINGAWVNPSQANNLDVINAGQGSVSATISIGTETEANIAVHACKEALKTWGVSSREQRVKVLE